MSASVLAPPAAGAARWPSLPPRWRAATARAGAGIAGLLVLVLLWWAGIALLTAPGSIARAFGPMEGAAALARLLAEGEVLIHAGVSLRRVLVGLGAALLIGVPLGLALGAWRGLERATGPAFQFLRMISPLSWMPIAVMAFGVGDAPVHVLLGFAAVWPVMLNTAAGVRALDPRWIMLARSLAASRRETLWRVVLPGVLGHVLTGVRLAIGILWVVLVPCEMLGVSAGLGYAILDARDRLAYAELTALVLLVGALGFALDAAARALCRRRGG
jgi:NitT/TauT family transport system permease protein